MCRSTKQRPNPTPTSLGPEFEGLHNFAMAAIAALHVAVALAAVAAAAAAAAAPPPAPPPSNVSYISSVRYPMEGGNTISLCTSP